MRTDLFRVVVWSVEVDSLWFLSQLLAMPITL